MFFAKCTLSALHFGPLNERGSGELWFCKKTRLSLLGQCSHSFFFVVDRKSVCVCVCVWVGYNDNLYPWLCSFLRVFLPVIRFSFDFNLEIKFLLFVFFVSSIAAQGSLFLPMRTIPARLQLLLLLRTPATIAPLERLLWSQSTLTQGWSFFAKLFV